MERLGNSIKIVLAATWIGLVGAGWYLMADYQSRPGVVGSVGELPASWQIDSEAKQVFVFLHPRCPCSRATVDQLHRIVNDSPQSRVTAFFYCPALESSEWVETALWTAANRIPSVRPHIDRDAKIAREFGVATSGHVIMFSGAGKPLFSGGITPGRGHQGDCIGAEDLSLALRGQLTQSTQHPVFGCQLYEGT